MEGGKNRRSGLSFCEAILRCGYACTNIRKSVYQSEQALLLSLQKLFGLLAPFVCESEQALVLDSQIQIAKNACPSVGRSKHCFWIAKTLVGEFPQTPPSF